MLRRFFDFRVGSVLVAAVLGFGLIACGNSGDSEGGDSGTVTVFAAASLTEAFTELGKVYEDQNDGSKVRFSFAGSSDLAGQIEAGAPADVFASADEPNMKKVTDAELNEGAPVDFAGNVLEIAVPKGNPGEVKGLDDLARNGLVVAVCDLEVPCGNAAQQVFAKAGVEPSVDSFEPDVKSVLAKVEMGEVDAGLVYHSDVLAAGDAIESIEIPDDVQVVNTYPIALIKDGENLEGGQAFIDLVLSETGVKELKKRGFRSP